MKGHGQELGRKKEQAIAALVAQRSLEESAKAVKISLATLKRWLRLPEFQAEYLQARRQGVQQANARSVTPSLRCSMATTWAVLLPWCGTATSFAGAACLALVAFWEVVVWWVALPLAGAPWATCAPRLAWRSAFG